MQADTVAAPVHTGSETTARAANLVAIVAVGLLGAVIIWGVGFAPIAALHNAAHDTRHSLVFPCH